MLGRTSRDGRVGSICVCSDGASSCDSGCHHQSWARRWAAEARVEEAAEVRLARWGGAVGVEGGLEAARAAVA